MKELKRYVVNLLFTFMETRFAYVVVIRVKKQNTEKRKLYRLSSEPLNIIRKKLSGMI